MVLDLTQVSQGVLENLGLGGARRDCPAGDAKQHGLVAALGLGKDGTAAVTLHCVVTKT